MQTPTEIEKYSKYFNTEKLFAWMQNMARKAGLKIGYLALQLYYVLKSDTVDQQEKLKICGALGYLILPIDLIPDAIPVLGFSDDLAALIYAFRQVKQHITPEIEEQAKNKLTEWFGAYSEDELNIMD